MSITSSTLRRAVTQPRSPSRTANALARDMEQAIQGEVRFDAETRAAYSRDGSNYRQIPIGVITPQDADDVEAAIDVCHQHGAPVLARGGGTSLAGQCCNVAVMFDFSKHMNKVLEVNVEEQWARVQPGVILDHLQEQTRPHNLCYGPDPSTHNRCTLGGMIGNNSCGVHSLMAGRTVDNVHELEILTYDGLRLHVGPTDDDELNFIISQGGGRGSIYENLRALRDKSADVIRERFPDIPRRVSGYCLDELLPEKGFQVARALVGTESTCVLVLEAKVRLVHDPPYRTLAVVCYEDIYAAADDVPRALQTAPIGLEGIDDRLIEDMRMKRLKAADLALFPEGFGGWLLVEFGGNSEKEANDRAENADHVLREHDRVKHVKLYEQGEEERKIWEIREAGLAATAFVPQSHDTWPGWEDSAVPRESLGDYLRDFRQLLKEFNYECSFYGHFGDGLLHTRIDFELRTQQGIDDYRTFAHEAAQLVNEYGGSYSGEHGDGQSRGELLPALYGDELMQAFRRFKAIWDPQWRMNPGKVVEPYRMDENLALGTDYRPPDTQTHLSYPEDHGEFSHATLRCVGVGECRSEEGGTMCPSYMVTRDEVHTTRGRARLLYEMLEGDVITDGWQSEEVHDALDLCLACKGCKGDCPVNVDMATYKAEFLAHYYERKWRPRSAWAMGLIDVWARLASNVPRLVNFAAQTTGLKQAARWAGGISQKRRIPAFAAEQFTKWFRRRPMQNADGPEVLLWPDTFNNHFHPETAKAAVEVLEHLGWRVTIPDVHLCCGRPLYDCGLLDRAQQYLRRILDSLSPQIEAGVPLVGLEPSCLAVFRDEMVNLLPHDEHARRLHQQSFSLAEFLTTHVDEERLPNLIRRALVHGHCHHKALFDMTEDRKLLDQLGLDCTILDSGCCGMAGSFGFEQEHYDLSVACGERVLLPAVREAEPEDLIIADGFSCQEQIEQLTGRRALHTAQVMQMALREDADSVPQPFPENRYRVRHEDIRLTNTQAVCGLGALLIGAAVGYRLIRPMTDRFWQRFLEAVSETIKENQ